MYQGSCLCQSIRFTLDDELRGGRYCHCANCRKFSGTSPVAWATASSSKLAVTISNASVSKFNSGRGIRCFCSNCGSPTWFESLDFPDIVAVPLGVLDDQDIQAPEMHIWVKSRTAWSAINDEMPQHKSYPPPESNEG